MSKVFRKRNKDANRAKFSELLPYLFERRGLLAIITVLSILGALTALAQPLIVGQVITLVGEQQPLGLLLWALIALVLASALFNSFQHYLLQRMGEGVVLSSRKNLLAKILHLPIGEFDRRRTGDLVSRVGSDTTLLRAVLTQGLVEIIGGSLLFIGALIAMLLIDPVLFLVTFGVLFVALVTVIILSSQIRPAVQKSQKKVGDLAAGVDRSISSIRTIRASGATNNELENNTRDAHEAYILGLKVAKISALIVPVSFVSLQVSLLSVLGFGGYRVAQEAITISQLVMFIIFLFMLLSPLGQAFGAISSANQALGALGRIQEVLRIESETQNDATIAATTEHQKQLSLAEARAKAAGAPAISLENVHFTYRSVDISEVAAVPEKPARGFARKPAVETPEPKIIETSVLHGVSFDVFEGKRVALVGPSGAGKSTILGLIERFYDPDSGIIRFHGTDIRALKREELRSQIGYVEQDAPVLAGTLRDNLLLASPEATDAECEAVLRQVNLQDLLTRPGSQGLDTEVGESGVMLSGGEKQRLAIARALLAAPPILLLDESTASLDGVNENLMRDALDSVASGRTLIVIAHRLSTVHDSDMIVVLEEGKVLGSGTHDELVESLPLYRQLAQHQLLVPKS